VDQRYRSKRRSAFLEKAERLAAEHRARILPIQSTGAMGLKSRLQFLLVITLMVHFMVTFAAGAQSLADGPGKAQLQRICSACHGLDTVTSQRMTSAEWSGVVNDMVSRGAQGSEDDLGKVVLYLSANFSKDKPAVAVARTTQTLPAVQKQAPLSAAQVAKAGSVLNLNACFSCHRIAATGSYRGPNLTDIGLRRTPQQLRALLLSPSKEVSAENRSVRIVTSTGEIVTGRILNQDGFSVQLIDSSSKLRSFQKSGLRQFEIISMNPMPSYADKLSPEDLDSLIGYLSSLKGTDGP
jgi:putative heme-binding domain-containing protein